jgi:hypothetical protein
LFDSVHPPSRRDLVCSEHIAIVTIETKHDMSRLKHSSTSGAPQRSPVTQQRQQHCVNNNNNHKKRAETTTTTTPTTRLCFTEIAREVMLRNRSSCTDGNSPNPAVRDTVLQKGARGAAIDALLLSQYSRQRTSFFLHTSFLCIPFSA